MASGARSLGSSTTRAFGSDVKAVGEVVRDWRRWRYKSTVPSPNPIARWERLLANATEDTWSQLQMQIAHLRGVVVRWAAVF